MIIHKPFSRYTPCGQGFNQVRNKASIAKVNPEEVPEAADKVDQFRSFLLEGFGCGDP
jgi:hypothetical protein